MCTVTIVPVARAAAPNADAGVGFRMVCSRDEQRRRAPADPPRRRTLGDRGAVMPTDGEAGGTWVALNDRGVAGTLLNLNLDGRTPQRRPRSRGLILPDLLACGSAAEAAERLRHHPPGDCEPFRLVLLDAASLHVARSDGEAMTVDACGPPVDRPFMITSSGLGDARVERPRRELFEAMFAGPPDSWLDAQQHFHAHRWPDRAALSVLMSRDDARTVSITRVDLGPRLAMGYWADPMRYPDRDAARWTDLAGDPR